MKNRGATYKQQLHRCAAEFEQEHKGHYSAKELARWAIKTKRWSPHPQAMENACARDFARALREVYHTDPQGRRVRSKHCAKLGKGVDEPTLWGDMQNSSSEFMQLAFTQRRENIVGDCVQLKNDVDSFNQNHNAKEPIQMIFDFNDDLLEAAQRPQGQSAVDAADEEFEEDFAGALDEEEF